MPASSCCGNNERPIVVTQLLWIISQRSISFLDIGPWLKTIALRSKADLLSEDRYAALKFRYLPKRYVFSQRSIGIAIKFVRLYFLNRWSQFNGGYFLDGWPFRKRPIFSQRFTHSLQQQCLHYNMTIWQERGFRLQHCCTAKWSDQSSKGASLLLYTRQPEKGKFPGKRVQGVVPTFVPNIGSIWLDGDLSRCSIYLGYGSLNGSIGLDETSCSGRWSHTSILTGTPLLAISTHVTQKWVYMVITSSEELRI